MVEEYATVLDEVCDPLTVRKFSVNNSISRKKAMSILEDYVKLKGAPVWALYEISGSVDSSQFVVLPEGEKLIRHVVVPESELDAAKEQFVEVFSTCLHSIQRTNPKETRVYGRSWDNNDDLAGVNVPQQSNQKKKTESPAKKVEVKKEKSASPGPSTSSKPSEPVKKDNKTIIQPKKQQNVLSMFAKKVEKKTEESEKSRSLSPSPPPPEQAKKTRKRPKVEIDEPEPEEQKEKKKTPTPEKKKSVFEPNDDDMPSSREQTPEKESEPTAKKRKSGINDENRKVKKARKLIVPDEEEDQQMEVDEVKEKPKLKEVKTEERRRTTRMEKVVETFVDEDGYLVSKEVTKAVECSPHQSPEKPKPKVITAPVPGAAKVPKKNATITSFFKKK